MNTNKLMNSKKEEVEVVDNYNNCLDDFLAKYNVSVYEVPG